MVFLDSEKPITCPLNRVDEKVLGQFFNKNPIIAAAFGTTTGVFFHLFCTAFGLAVILKTSAIAFAVWIILILLHLVLAFLLPKSSRSEFAYCSFALSSMIEMR